MQYVVQYIGPIIVIIIILIIHKIYSDRSGGADARQDKAPILEKYHKPAEDIFKVALEIVQKNNEIRIDSIDNENRIIEGSTEFKVTGGAYFGILILVVPISDKSCVSKVFAKVKLGWGPIANSTALNLKKKISNSIKAKSLYL